MQNPNYEDIGDYTETVQIEYDPTIISFKDMMYEFFYTQTCPHLNTRRQYRSIVFYKNDEEKDIALKVKGEIEEKLNEKFDTDILPYKNFYKAEDYHQKFYFKRLKKLYKEMKDIYPNENDLTMSTAVGHINGYVHGFGTLEKLKNEIDLLGLSKESQELLISFVNQLNR